MSTWGTTALQEALPTQDAAPVSDAPAEDAAVDPRAHGWAAPEAYDYGKYNMSSKEYNDAQKAAFEEQAAHNSANDNTWAGSAPMYEWKGEYGDVGPRFPDIEAILFGSGDDTGTGVINFENLTKIAVIQEGNVRIKPIRKFADAGLHPAMLENVQLARYNVPTPIQQYTLPAIEMGHDVIACAQTGSGKTAAFLIPIFNKLMGKAKKLAANRPNPSTYDPTTMGQIRAEPLVLIVCPTRELATQIFDEARKLAYRTMLRPAVVYGGGPLGEQIAQLGKGADILIGTPGRLIDFINRPHLLTLRRLKFMVIDEADEMLHADWESELKQIMSGGDQEEGNITYLMFSATFPKSIRDLAKEHLREDHVRIRVGRIGSTHENIKQDIIFVGPEHKKKALFDLLMSHPPARTIIFVNSKRAADDLDDFLFNKNMPCTSIHADRTQREREDSIRSFRSGRCPIMIATGVSSRGIDVANVAHVINYDLPPHQHGGIEEYTHRIGRTGRAGKTGLATSFFNDRDTDLAESLVKTLLETHQVIPDFLEEHIPEGFTADGQGDVNRLHFDADSDLEEDENAEGESGAAWGGGNANAVEAAPAAAPAAAWGAPAAPVVPVAQPAAAVPAWTGGDGW